MTSKSKIIYIEPDNAGEPCCTLADLLVEVADNAGLKNMPLNYCGMANKPAKGRRKVKITITVEAVP